MAEAEGRTDHIQGEILHVYDGIEEADNELPTWWLITFYGAIAFAVVYWFAYHELEALPLPPQEYAAALAEQAGDQVSEELLVALADDPDAVAGGQELFATHCEVCHKARGEGNIGPNLTDPNWIHGGSPVDIHVSISDGWLQNGMPAWGQTLGPEAVQRLTAFVLSIRDTNVAGGKEPEGEVWAPEGEPVEAEEAPEELEEEEEGEMGESTETDAEDGEVEPTAPEPER